MTRGGRWVALGSVALALCACGGAAARSGGAAGLRPCGLRTAPPSAWRHVVWIWLENESYSQVIGSGGAPFLTALAHACGTAADYSAISHPSLPNYLAGTSGSTWGVADDDPPSSHPIRGRSIFGEVSAAGLTWRSFEESMPRRCDLVSSGDYAVKHNPAAYYVGIRTLCSRWDVPLSALRVGALPAFSFVAPNLCHDMHSCPVSTGDAWLRRFVTALVAGRSYRAGNTVVFVTFDEGTDAENRVATVVVSPSTRPGTVSTTRFDHDSLLRTTAELLGLPPIGTGASMARAFGLSPSHA